MTPAPQTSMLRARGITEPGRTGNSNFTIDVFDMTILCSGCLHLIFKSRPAQAYLGSGRAQHFLLGGLLLDVDPSLEVGAVLNGDALARDVARDNG
jgi:hypothetical protein